MAVCMRWRLKPLAISTILGRNYSPKLITTNVRSISTTNKNKESTTAVESVVTKEKTSTQVKNWVSYGYDYEDEAKDRYAMHLVWFSSITLVLVGGSFLVMYAPDIKNRDWASREGYLELHRREKLGLPLIDPDLVPREKFLLPSDEELGDTEIVI